MVSRLRTILEEKANGVYDPTTGRFYPFVPAYLTTATNSLTPPTSSARLYVKSISMHARTVAGDTCNAVQAGITINSVFTVLAKILLRPGVDLEVNAVFPDLGYLGDPGFGVGVTYGVAQPTISNVLVRYAVVENE